MIYVKLNQFGNYQISDEPIEGALSKEATRKWMIERTAEFRKADRKLGDPKGIDFCTKDAEGNVLAQVNDRDLMTPSEIAAIGRASR